MAILCLSFKKASLTRSVAQVGPADHTPAQQRTERVLTFQIFPLFLRNPSPLGSPSATSALHEFWPIAKLDRAPPALWIEPVQFRLPAGKSSRRGRIFPHLGRSLPQDFWPALSSRELVGDLYSIYPLAHKHTARFPRSLKSHSIFFFLVKDSIITRFAVNNVTLMPTFWGAEKAKRAAKETTARQGCAPAISTSLFPATKQTNKEIPLSAQLHRCECSEFIRAICLPIKCHTGFPLCTSEGRRGGVREGKG